MPELPEVETIRRGIEPRIRGRRVVEAGSHPSAKFTPARDITGAAITGVGRRGKYLLVHLDDGRELVVHLGMTGQLHLAAPDRPDDDYVRAWWTLDDGALLRYRDVRRFGRLRVVPAGDHRTIATLHAMGPEPLSDAFTPAGLWAALRQSSRPVKTQLLTQRAVAGVGNIYADEALWLARIHPRSRRISRARAAALHQAIRDVLQQGIDNGGTTLRDYRSFDGSPGENQGTLACYGRVGEPCPRCDAVLTSAVIDARTTTWCPSCQRR